MGMDDGFLKRQPAPLSTAGDSAKTIRYVIQISPIREVGQLIQDVFRLQD